MESKREVRIRDRLICELLSRPEGSGRMVEYMKKKGEYCLSEKKRDRKTLRSIRIIFTFLTDYQLIAYTVGNGRYRML